MPPDQTNPNTPAGPSPIIRLIEALRSPLPPGFRWDFRRYDNCACGLAEYMGLSLSAIDRAIGISDDPFEPSEKNGVVPRYGVPARKITPAMVADALELLAKPSSSPRR